MTKSFWRVVVGLAVVALLGEAAAQPDDWRLDRVALQESLASMPRWQRARWLQDRNLPVPWQQSVSDYPDSGLRVVGRWSYGPAVSVDVKATATDTLLFLARGSGVSIIRFGSRDSLTFDLLADINSRALTGHVIAQDTLLYVNCAGVEVYGINNPAEPRLLGHLSATITDFSVTDTFLYTISGDSFRAYSVADPANVRRIGGCRDSGAVMTVSGGYAYLGHRYGLHILDVRDPAQPRRVAAIGADVISVAVSDTVLVFGHYEQGISIYGVTNPASPRQLGSVPGVVAPGLFIPPTCDTVLYTPSLDVISLADPRSPRVLGQVICPGWDNGVAAAPALNYAFVADDYKGMAAVSVTQPSAPTIDTLIYAGDQALDICLGNGKAYVASYRAGLQILDATDPSSPSYLGCYDTAGSSRQVTATVARDSFAFVSWPVPRMLSIDVTDPTNPVRAGTCEGMFGPPEDMVVRDSFVYCAEGRRLQVVNAARPREPRLVGSCVDEDYTWDLDLEGNVAAVAHTISLRLVDVTQPTNPQVVGAWSGDVSGVDIIDTIAYVTAPYTGFVALSIANPTSPYVMDSLHLTDTLWWNDVVVVDSLAFVGGERIWVVDVSNPRDLRLVPSAAWTPPYLVRRLEYSAPYLYAACHDAGVCILDCTQVAVGEGPGAEHPLGKSGSLRPNPTAGVVSLCPDQRCERLVVRDVLGRTVLEMGSCGTAARIDLTGLKPGLYFVELGDGARRRVEKLIRR